MDGTKAASVASPGYEVVCEMRVERRTEGLKALRADGRDHLASVRTDSIAEVIDGANHRSVAKQGGAGTLPKDGRASLERTFDTLMG